MKPDPTISVFLDTRIAAGDFPSAVYLISETGEPIFGDSLGLSVVEPQNIAASIETIYDLASLTKPLITGLLCALRIELGELTLDSSVAQYLTEFDRPDRHSITLRHLLTHTSGLPAWRPLYKLTESEQDRTVSVIASEKLEHAPGTEVVYSDLGFIVLGRLLERLTGKSIAELAQAEIIEPLKLMRTFFNPNISLQKSIAASERGNQYETEMCLNGGHDKDNFRAYLIWGEVHDGNAFFLGGAAGHAGLFSTAYETSALAQQFLANQSQLLKRETCSLFSQNMTEGLGQARSLAWQLAATQDSTAGPQLPADSYGHTGFTGTSCWVDPHNERVFVLLTNRTHNRKPPFTNINPIRREFHNLAVSALSRTAL